jgi:AhpD family alkylhydroperoxidase
VTTTSAAPRIAPGTRRDVGVVNWIVSIVSGRMSRSTPPNLFLTMGRHRRLFLNWLRFAGRLMPGGKLPRRETELVILRVAHTRACAYEFDHHARLGRRNGLSADDVDRIRRGPEDPAWSPREHAILAAVDALQARGDLTDEEWVALRAHLDEREAIELIMLAGHYEMLATFINTLRIQPDRRR